nr:MAG TPA: hypothetical protein [Inoviridae sp.]
MICIWKMEEGFKIKEDKTSFIFFCKGIDLTNAL